MFKNICEVPVCEFLDFSQQENSQTCEFLRILNYKLHNHILKQNPMSLVKQIRLKTGLTQKQLGVYLEISTSNICMIEKGKRTLSGEKLLKLLQLHIRIEQHKEVEQVESINYSSKRKKRRNQRLCFTLHQLEQKQKLFARKLQARQRKHELLTQQLKISQTLAAKPPEKMNDPEAIIFTLVHLERKTAMIRQDEVDLALMELQADILHLRTERLREIIEKYRLDHFQPVV